MISLWEIMAWAKDKSRFTCIDDYITFAKTYLDFINHDNIQAEIVAKNETNYHFYQYRQDGEYNITRPVNGNLFLPPSDYETFSDNFSYILQNIKDITDDSSERQYLNRFIYTTQQTIGCALDALPASKSNFSRKINGDLFEKLILLILQETGISADTGIVDVPTSQEKETMRFQNDIQITVNGEIAAIGSVKTTSKDRLSKMFLDKIMYNSLTGTETSHFAVFLHDVQRSGKEPNYKVGQTFPTGHYKAYTITLSPFDGVYYCDLRPIMKTDPTLKAQIKSLDCLLCEDMWKFIE